MDNFLLDFVLVVNLVVSHGKTKGDTEFYVKIVTLHDSYRDRHIYFPFSALISDINTRNKLNSAECEFGRIRPNSAKRRGYFELLSYITLFDSKI